jgi:hypothetical protein
VYFNEFCIRNWGNSSDIFKDCRLLAKALVDDGLAEYTPNNPRLVLITPEGSKFKGYVQSEINNQLANNKKRN